MHLERQRRRDLVDQAEILRSLWVTGPPPAPKLSPRATRNLGRAPTAASKPSSTQSASSMSGGILNYRIQLVINSVKNVFKKLKEAYDISLAGLVIMPIIFTVIVGAAVMIILNLATHQVLPAIFIYNAIHTIIFVISELFLLSVSYTLSQIVRFEVAWTVALRHSTAEKIMKGAKGSVNGKLGKLILIMLIVFEVCILANTFLAEWTPVEQDLVSRIMEYP
jgi:hypothetical protein